jgi:hypothetical protein
MNAYYYVLGMMLLGALWGAFLASRRGGRALDMAQYAGSLAILGGILGVLLTVILSRFA